MSVVNNVLILPFSSKVIFSTFISSKSIWHLGPDTVPPASEVLVYCSITIFFVFKTSLNLDNSWSTRAENFALSKNPSYLGKTKRSINLSFACSPEKISKPLFFVIIVQIFCIVSSCLKSSSEGLMYFKFFADMEESKPKSLYKLG